MATPILATKLFVPPPRSKAVLRPHLAGRLNESLARKLTLLSAPAGFGKSALVSEWVAGCAQPVAWLSLDEGDSDPTCFLVYLIAALQTILPDTGAAVLGALQSPRPPSIEACLTSLLNEIAAVRTDFVLVLDDYHTVDSKPVDQAITYLLEHQPAQMHLVIATREDPDLPLAQLRSRGELTELRARELRFSASEAARFLNQMMGLQLSTEEIAALEARTEGWIAGLQLAAISMQGIQDTAGFIKSFTGSHRFVMDYLVEEVLKKQPEKIQAFLLRTSILERLCGPLCEAVMLDPESPGQETLEYLEHANLFLFPLDNERRWYRYHHLFSELLRQRLQSVVSGGDEKESISEYHQRASTWYESHGLEIEAFHHAAAANDVSRAARLIEGKGMPLHLRGALCPVLSWLDSLPKGMLDERPMLWILHAGALTTAGQTTNVEEKLQAAEAALQGAEPSARTRDLLGRIANNRATLAISRYQADLAISQAKRALEHLSPDNLPIRTINTWILGVAYQIKGERALAGDAFTEAISSSQKIGQTFVMQLATCGLGSIQESQNRLRLAADTYQHAIQLFGQQPLPHAAEAYLGLARIFYEWNDLEAAERHARQSIQLARQYAEIIDRHILGEIFLTRLVLAQGDIDNAASLLAEVDRSVRQHNFVYRVPEVAAAQVSILLREGNLAAAAQLARMHDLPASQARVYLAQHDSSAALAMLAPLLRQVEARGWEDERLQVMVLQALAHYMHGERDQSVQLLGEALRLAEPEGFIRLFVDEGPPMTRLLAEAGAKGIMPGYVSKLLAAFKAEGQAGAGKGQEACSTQPLIEPLSQREREILRLIAQGLSNQAISERLFLALSTVKGHNRMLFDKLHVQSRTEAVARARELGLL